MKSGTAIPVIGGQLRGIPAFLQVRDTRTQTLQDSQESNRMGRVNREGGNR